MASKKKDKIDLETIEVQGLENRLRAGRLTDADVDSLLKMISLVQTLRTLLQKRSLGLRPLKGKNFWHNAGRLIAPPKSVNIGISLRNFLDQFSRERLKLLNFGNFIWFGLFFSSMLHFIRVIVQRW
ncbi:MAG: hypothetical protein H7249_02635 [Chitinophagaceae bacterium]|nr:hypothetical protein [Oligoflexus sp.]